MSALLVAALAYTDAAVPVFPCGRDKEPLTRNGFYDASTSKRVVVKWWTRWPDAAIGIPTGVETFDVLDVDVKATGTGFPALGRLARAGLVAGSHRMVRTPSGGLHLYYRPSGNGNGSLRTQHLDSRGTGGYVIAPPSVINGGRYVIEEDRPDATGTLDWAACRRLLAPPLVGRSAQRSSTGSIAGLIAWLSAQPAVQGGRNHQLFWACSRAVEDHGAGEADLAALVAVAVSLGLTERESLRTARSALTRRRTSVGAA